MQVVVTGGAGFIGSHLVDRLVAEGHQVTVLDNLSTGSKANLAGVTGRKNLRIHTADVADHDAIHRFFEGADWVFHLAALADIVPSIERPLEYHRANVDGTVSVLEASRRAGVRRFVYTASASCYGIPRVYPTPETEPVQPQYPYALTKYLGEELALSWGRMYKLPIISLRLFNVYGPRARTSGSYGAVFGVFLAQKLAGRPFTVVGDGSQTRDFTFVSDGVEALFAAARSDVKGEVLNVGSGASISINQLVRLLEGDVVHTPKRPGEPDCTWADISKIKRLLGWAPQVSFEAGVRVMLDHMEDWRNAPVWTAGAIEEATREWFACLS